MWGVNVEIAVRNMFKYFNLYNLGQGIVFLLWSGGQIR